MDSEDLQARVHKRLLDLRNIERIVVESTFSLAFSKASSEQRFAIYLAIEEENADNLRVLIRAILKIDMTSRDLRDRAAELHVRGYSRLTKEELGIAIHTKESRK